MTTRRKPVKRVTRRSSTKRFLEDIMGGPLSIGGMLEAHRLGEEMTLREMGEILGISRQKLHDIEKGRRAVSVKMAASFARALGLHEGHWVKVAVEEQLRAAGLERTVKIEAA